MPVLSSLRSGKHFIAMRNVLHIHVWLFTWVMLAHALRVRVRFPFPLTLMNLSLRNTWSSHRSLLTCKNGESSRSEWLLYMPMFLYQVKPYLMSSEPNETFTNGLCTLRHIGSIELESLTEHRCVCMCACVKFYLPYLHCGALFTCCFLICIRELSGLRQAPNVRKD
jgi:hypothetical protein